jgi:hypothetical protein
LATSGQQVGNVQAAFRQYHGSRRAADGNFPATNGSPMATSALLISLFLLDIVKFIVTF